MAFDSESAYIVSAESDSERIVRIRAIISVLETRMIEAAADTGIEEYTLNDGQVTIRTRYRSPSDIAKAITDFDNILTRLIARSSCTRVVSLRDARSFNLLQRT